MEQIKKITEFKSFAEMLKILPDDDSCRKYLEFIRWNNIPTCPHCLNMNVNHYQLKTKGIFKGLYKCKYCRERFTVTVGTVFEGSHVPLRKWFIAVYIFSAHKKGISSHQLGKDLGITQKSAWFILGRIRYAFKVKSLDLKIDGIVQVDESFVGGKNKNRHAHKKVPQSQGRSFKDKTPVLGIVNHLTGEVRTVVIPNTKSTTIKPIIKEMVEAGSIIISDEWHGYKGLTKDYSHIVLNHKEKEFVRGEFHNNTIEGFWSLMKRGVFGIYHQVSRKHLYRYCDEFSYRYNARKMTDSNRFNLSLVNVEGRLTYKELTKKVEAES